MAEKTGSNPPKAPKAERPKIPTELGATIVAEPLGALAARDTEAPFRKRAPVPEDEKVTRLWNAVQKGTDQIRFEKFLAYVNDLDREQASDRDARGADRRLPICRDVGAYGLEAYKALKKTAELFLVKYAAIVPAYVATGADASKLVRDQDPVDVAIGALQEGMKDLEDKQDKAVEAYRVFETSLEEHLENSALPYFRLIAPRVASVPPRLLFEKMTCPLLLELIWSYWHEEGLLVQALNTISLRYQNRRLQGSAHLNPLYRMEIEPLRPLANVIWGYVREEPHRLSVQLRAHEYSHEYGLELHGKAVSMHPADRRARFLEAFHNLLSKCIRFYAQMDDLMVEPDAFPVLNALKEVQLILGEGAHNQFGELPFNARAEMLVQQWMLAQPEMQQFLGGRAMTPYPEAWMDRVDSLKGLLGLNDVSVIHYRDLGFHGERLLLTVRYGPWAEENRRESAYAWAARARDDVQGYVHAYRAVTGVDLATATDARGVNATLPSTLLTARRSSARTVR